ncbi:hypothetical protein LEP1GSC034_0221 [Leptospira interrogans str. 2003000735]|uniref:Uncharacterized protein n=2 Tax=Leptospira interrogans TaxID=173 RepID=N1UQ85_LEPIR|nr:hypothetical protein [Leptospira interrogans]EMY05375.1 hypothetical protein LEP1GSC029_3363 [Leptospira interrogans str. 2002000626]EMY22778.1 hypothetical protein LEP1GSC115_2948 [Leptospira interrogans serovar Australis str. 200703203]EKN88937.1 hypothetical protein LEP1GSC027_4178 [Leptospira interrogans str. 2002000624]EKQ36897.1 hypothetical protein LEP1GSC025_0788 [Leptospira interrogans str. 2002000621]EKQ49794.1 hypothetical protein LEP1GSC026_4696 [Leptospira interrogans str. 2002
MSKTQIEVVGQSGDRNIYIQFFKGAEPVKGQLWKLQYPGNKIVDEWSEDMVRSKDGELQLKSSFRTEKFFKSCVMGVTDPVDSLEEELVEQYGATPTKTLKRDDIHPRLYGLWGKLIPRFLDGSIWDDLPESDETANGSGDKGGDRKEDQEE